jgi:signal transduction histidine kinase/ligand-binding sensor domain-containing protein/DNA-binding response OmpR family regulator
MLSAADIQLSVEHLTTKQGLPHNKVNCIAQDEDGLLYFGTSYGAALYDGYKFEKLILSDHATNFRVQDIAICSGGNVWIATYQCGLILYNRQSGEITQFLHSSLYKQLSKIRNITTLEIDSKGTLWVGTAHNGVFTIINANLTIDALLPQQISKQAVATNKVILCFLPEKDAMWIGTHGDGLIHYKPLSQTSTRYNSSLPDNLHLAGNEVWALQNKGNTLLVGTNNGLDLLDTEQEIIRHYYQKPHHPQIGSNIIKAFSAESETVYWAATQEDGLYRLEFKGDNLHRQVFRHHPTDKSGLNVNSLLSLFHDRSGILWIGTWTGGINKYDPATSKFKNIRYHDQTSLPASNQVWSICQAGPESIWLGTHSMGLCRYTTGERTLESIPIPGERRDQHSNSITKINSSNNQLLLLGTWGSGLHVINYKGKKLFPKLRFNKAPEALNDSRIYSIYEDLTGNFWIGTTNIGVVRYKPEDEKPFKLFDKVPTLARKLYHNDIRSITEDSKGQLWLATRSDGLLKVRKDDMGEIYDVTTYAYTFPDSLPKSEKHLANYALFTDSNGYIWVGTEAGIIRIHPETDEQLFISEANGLSNNIITEFTEDQQGHIWVSTFGGLSRIHAETLTINTFHTNISFYGIFFHPALKLMYAGSDHGLYEFNPLDLPTNTYLPQIIFTDFRIHHTSIQPGAPYLGKNILSKPINHTSDIVLPHNLSDFAIDFSALSYSMPQKNSYRFMLEGFDQQWHPITQKQRTATYTNLTAGTYTFKVMAANSQGQWNPTPRILKITILPPWWKSNLAYMLYVCLAILAIFLLIRFVQSKERLKHAMEVRKLEHERNDTVSRMKLAFFTNISHELRTPLTLLSGPLEILMERDNDGWRSRQYEIIHKSTRTLMRLVSQILDFRKIENHKLKLVTELRDLRSFIQEKAELFQEQATEKGLKLTVHTPGNAEKTYFDGSKMEQVLNNLLSNAIKFTPPKGKISVSLSKTDNYHTITISDTGCGIGRDHLPYIFDRFYQSNEAQSIGTGLGLAISKGIVELHKGSIEVKSEPNKGSTFTISLPRSSQSEINITDSCFTDDQQQEPQDDKIKILVIDDNAEIREFISDNLQDTYEILEANDGVSGLQVVKKTMPSLIICDVMMESMQGTEVCQTLKNDRSTSHIPVILLTAKTSIESRIKGLETGADDYITKPFSMAVLRSRIKNILTQRDKLQADFRQKLALEPQHTNELSLDEKFLEETKEHIIKNISETDYSIDDLSTALHMTHDHFYRKIKALTGLTANQFIRRIKLNRAAELLIQTDLTIAEIVWQTGFNHQSYFSKCFKQQFNCLPSDYRKTAH